MRQEVCYQASPPAPSPERSFSCCQTGSYSLWDTEEGRVGGGSEAILEDFLEEAFDITSNKHVTKRGGAEDTVSCQDFMTR